MKWKLYTSPIVRVYIFSNYGDLGLSTETFFEYMLYAEGEKFLARMWRDET